MFFLPVQPGNRSEDAVRNARISFASSHIFPSFCSVEWHVKCIDSPSSTPSLCDLQFYSQSIIFTSYRECARTTLLIPPRSGRNSPSQRRKKGTGNFALIFQFIFTSVSSVRFWCHFSVKHSIQYSCLLELWRHNIRYSNLLTDSTVKHTDTCSKDANTSSHAARSSICTSRCVCAYYMRGVNSHFSGADSVDSTHVSRSSSSSLLIQSPVASRTISREEKQCEDGREWIGKQT